LFATFLDLPLIVYQYGFQPFFGVYIFRRFVYNGLDAEFFQGIVPMGGNA